MAAIRIASAQDAIDIWNVNEGDFIISGGGDGVLQARLG